MNNNSIFESPRAVRTQIQFTVKVNNSKLISRVAEWEIREMERITRYASNIDIPSVEDMTKYLKNVLYMRVQKVSGAKIEQSFKHIFRDLYLPARWYTLLDNLGEAHDMQSNIKFFPAYSIEAVDVLTADQMIEISEQLQAIKMDGYSCEKGIPQHTEGSVEMMAKVALAEGQALDTIRGMRSDNPVFAFFANLFQMEVIDLTYADLDKMYRVEYSAPSVYSANLRDYWSSVASKKQDASNSSSNEGRGPAQPASGTQPPNLGHEGQGATNSNGNLK